MCQVMNKAKMENKSRNPVSLITFFLNSNYYCLTLVYLASIIQRGYIYVATFNRGVLSTLLVLLIVSSILFTEKKFIFL
jgi:hypothetical protein